MDIQESNFEGKRYVIVRKHISISQITDKNMYDVAFGKVANYLMANGIAIAGPGAVLYFKWNEPEGQAEIGVGFPVDATTTIADAELECVEVPSSKAIVCDLKGPYSGLEATHMGLNAYLKEHNLTYSHMAVEEYLVHPMSDPNPEHWLTRVSYLHS